MSLTSIANRYRCTSNVNLPFKVQPIVEEVSKSRVEYTVRVRANFDSKLNATHVVLRIPTPLNTTNVKCQVAMGKARYIPAENVILWKIDRIQGAAECTLQAEAERSSTTHAKAWSRPPIEVDFQVLMFTASGLLVRYLKVFEKSNCECSYHSNRATCACSLFTSARIPRPKREMGPVSDSGSGLVPHTVLKRSSLTVVLLCTLHALDLRIQVLGI